MSQQRVGVAPRSNLGRVILQLLRQGAPSVHGMACSGGIRHAGRGECLEEQLPADIWTRGWNQGSGIWHNENFLLTKFLVCLLTLTALV